MEARHLLVSEWGYSTRDIDDMPVYDFDMTSLIAVQTNKNKNKTE